MNIHETIEAVAGSAAEFCATHSAEARLARSVCAQGTDHNFNAQWTAPGVAQWWESWNGNDDRKTVIVDT